MSEPVKIDESRYDITFGVDAQLPFSTPYSPTTIRPPKLRDDTLYEVSPLDYDHNGPTIRELEIMRMRDGQAQALHRLLTLPIRSSLKTSSIVPAEGGEKEAKFIEDVFYTSPSNGGMSVPFSRVMAQILEGLFTGFSAFEKVFWKPKQGPLKGKIALKKLAYRPCSTVTFVTDDHGGFAGFRQRVWKGPHQIDVFIEPKYAMYYAAQEELRKFYGVSFFNAAFYHYDKKSKLYYTGHLAGQRSAVGTRLGTVPPGASRSQKEEFSRALANMSLAQYLAIPEGFEVEVLKEGGNFDYLDLINHHNSQMSKSVLANFFDKDQGSGSSGGSAISFAEPGDDMFVLMLKAIMDDIADAINNFLIPQLIELNFSKGRYPQFTWGTLTDAQKEAISATFDKLATAGQSLAITPEFMRSLEETMADEMGLDVDYTEVEAREQEEQAMAEAQFALEQGEDPQGGDPEAPPIDPEADAEALAELEAQALAV